MKTIPLAIAGSVLLAIFSGASVDAQVIKPPNPRKFETRGTGGLGTGSSIGVEEKKPAQQPKTVVIQYTAVSKAREWTNTDGKNMTAQLLAYSAPKPGEKGPVEVIREGKIKFLMTATKKPIEYPLEKLSQVDQIFVKAIAQAASKGAPNPGVEAKEGAEGSGKE